MSEIKTDIFPLKNWWFLLIAILAFGGLGIYSEVYDQQDPGEAYASRLMATIDAKESVIQELESNDTLMGLIRAPIFREDVLQILEDASILVFVREGGKLRFWSELDADPSLMACFDSTGTGMVDIPGGVYYYHSGEKGNQEYLFAYPVYRRYEIRNKELLNEGFAPELNIQCSASFSATGGSDYIQLVNSHLDRPHFIQFHNTSSRSWNWVDLLLFFTGLIFFVLFLQKAYLSVKAFKGSRVAWFMLVIVSVLVRGSMQFLQVPDFLYQEALFDSGIYRLNDIIPSFGDLIINAALFFLLIFIGFQEASRRLREQVFWQARPGVAALSSFTIFISSLFILGLMQSLIDNSTLNFDVTNILNSGPVTLLGLLVASLLLFGHFLMISLFTRWVEQSKAKLTHLILGLTVGIGVSVLIHLLVPEVSLVLIAQALTYSIALFITFQLVISQGFFQRTAVVLFVISVFSSTLFYRSLHDRELEQRQVAAKQIYSPKDLNAESYFLEIESKLEEDRFIQDYFRNPLILKSQLEKRIKQLYFTGYLSKYDINLYDYDTLGNHFKELNNFPYLFLEEVYNNRTQSTLSNHFYYINDASLRFGYIAKYLIQDKGGNLGTLYILLKPKFIQDENTFTELFSSSNDDKGVDVSEYSYAIYQNDYLISQSGSFPYPLNYDLPYTETGRFASKEGFSHFLSPEQGNIMVVVSKKRDSFLQPITVFSFLFLTFSLFMILVVALNFLYIYLRYLVANWKSDQAEQLADWLNKFNFLGGYNGIFFSSRIQLVTIGLVLLSLILTGYFTISYIGFKYGERQEERLDGKVRSILNAIENEKRFEEMMRYEDQLTAYLNQLAEAYNTDVNLYDLNGNLKSSTQMRMYQSGLLLDKINPFAFAKIETESRSQHKQHEEIGKLNYLASYVPLFDGQHQLLGYVNVPFFSNEQELQSELASFLESFLNIYVFLVLVAGILAYVVSQRITHPLTIIQSKLGQTRLGNYNERLDWKRDDEIGRLIRQYNFMVDELERSAELLAKSEREGAWKEMAKQIAHEIKNPLTPMKLSVQHLQRSWRMKSDNLEESFERVTNVLIEQIDSLSHLATEFSSFAKMPTAQIEEFELSDVMNGVVELYFNSEAVTINYSASKERMHVEADKDQLSRVFNNLIKNAIQAIPEERPGKIEISLELVDEFAQVTVQDNGIGISPELAKKIFTPSFSTKNSGMGLGLAISRQIIENIGGKIWFEDLKSQGTKFIVKLPLVN